MTNRLLFVLIAFLVACTPQQPSYYGPVQLAAGHRPGDLLDAQPFPGAPAGATATRILYASTALDGTPVPISALVIIPDAPSASSRPVLAWLHPTTGVASACAPTLGPTPFAQIQGLSLFLAAGYAIVATDYEGLGGPGTHPYLVGASEARAALDSVRALQRMPAAQAGPRFAVWGHSQGGHAALFTAALAPSYAPDLQLVGAAAAAPVTDMAALIERPAENPLWGGLLAYTVWSWSRVFAADPADIAPRATHVTIDRTAQVCLETGDELKQLITDSAPLSGQPIHPGDRWRALLAENVTPPYSGPPTFIAQGEADPVIDPALTRAFATDLCHHGIKLRYDSMPGVDHYTAAVKSAPTAAAWIADRFAGKPPPDDCANP